MTLEELLYEVELSEPIKGEDVLPFLNELQNLRAKRPSHADEITIRRLCLDAETWTDAADWKDNSSRILEVLRLLPPLL